MITAKIVTHNSSKISRKSKVPGITPNFCRNSILTSNTAQIISVGFNDSYLNPSIRNTVKVREYAHNISHEKFLKNEFN